MLMNRVSKTVVDAVYKRDKGVCLHCGSTEVTIQHRKNVGAGGAPHHSPLHQPQNLVLLCGAYNALIESDARQAGIARYSGWKCRTLGEAYEMPVFDVTADAWFKLDDKGGRAVADPPFPARYMMDVPF